MLRFTGEIALQIEPPGHVLRMSPGDELDDATLDADTVAELLATGLFEAEEEGED